MKPKSFLTAVATLAFAAVPLLAQDNPPPPQNPPFPPGPPSGEGRSAGPDARPGEPRKKFSHGPEPDPARPRGREFRKEFGPRDRDFAPQQREQGAPPQQRDQGPPPPPRQMDRREAPLGDFRRDDRGTRFGPRPPMADRGWRPPMEHWFGRERGPQRRMIEHFAAGPQQPPPPPRDERPDFRRGENEMRPPLPPRGPQFDRRGRPDRGPGLGADRPMRRDEQRGIHSPRPDFGPPDRGGEVPRFDRMRRGFDGPRERFDGPRPPMDRGPRDERAG